MSSPSSLMLILLLVGLTNASSFSDSVASDPFYSGCADGKSWHYSYKKVTTAGSNIVAMDSGITVYTFKSQIIFSDSIVTLFDVYDSSAITGVVSEKIDSAIISRSSIFGNPPADIGEVLFPPWDRQSGYIENERFIINPGTLDLGPWHNGSWAKDTGCINFIWSPGPYLLTDAITWNFTGFSESSAIISSSQKASPVVRRCSNKFVVNTIVSECADFTILNMAGKTIFNGRVREQSINIPQNIPAGFYAWRLVDGSSAFCGRVMIP